MPSHPNVVIRRAAVGDAEQLVVLRRALFAETSLMLWEPAEFVATAAEEEGFIQRLSERANRLLLVAFADGKAVGFLAAMGGERNCLRHSALLALGVLRAYWSQGVASRMLSEAISWAPGAGIKRLELAVHTTNTRAVALYQRHGFEIEGTMRSGLRVDGVYTDGYLMSFITGI
jgi:RimJ/RimL family protein N-acetyltransferase